MRHELDEDVEIAVETRKRILVAFHALEGRNHYELLGVERDADKKAIRNAYFELSKLFHPDAYFGKRARQLQGRRWRRVFKRLTEAYEVLGKAKKRAEYDEYLATTEHTRRAHRTLESIEFSEQEVAAARAAHAEKSTPETAGRRDARAALRPPPVPNDRRTRTAAPCGAPGRAAAGRDGAPAKHGGTARARARSLAPADAQHSSHAPDAPPSSRRPDETTSAAAADRRPAQLDPREQRR